MRHIRLSSLALLTLSACASLAEDPVQEVRFETPGARGALCTVNVDGFLYKVRPPQAVKLPKTGRGLSVDCSAPGNRRQKIFVESTTTSGAAANLANGLLPGLVWDVGTGGLYHYPDVVTIDFSSIAVRPEPMPAYNNPDIRQPEDYDLEEFRPGTPRLNSDRNAVPTELKRRERPDPSLNAAGYTERDLLNNAGQNKTPDKSGISAVINKLSPAMNPAGAPAGKDILTPPPPPPQFPGQ